MISNCRHSFCSSIHLPKDAIASMCKLLLVLVVFLRDILLGQNAPGGAGEGGAKPIRISPLYSIADSLLPPSPVDSLELHLLRIQMTSAEQTISETSIWMRLIPQVHMSTSFGIHDLMFVDPYSSSTYILPRDSYRMTLSLSLNDVLFSPKHAQALNELERLKTEESILCVRQNRSRLKLQQDIDALEMEIAILEKEMNMNKELLRFNELRFQQGKLEFDALTRTRLELLSIEKSLHKTQAQLFNLKLTTPLY